MYSFNDTWTQYLLPFDEARQGGWGMVADFDPTEVIGLRFQVAENLDFEVAIDNIGFY